VLYLAVAQEPSQKGYTFPKSPLQPPEWDLSNGEIVSVAFMIFFKKHIYLPLLNRYLGKKRLKLWPAVFLSFQEPYKSQGGETLKQEKR